MIRRFISARLVFLKLENMKNPRTNMNKLNIKKTTLRSFLDNADYIKRLEKLRLSKQEEKIFKLLRNYHFPSQIIKKLDKNKSSIFEQL